MDTYMEKSTAKLSVFNACREFEHLNVCQVELLDIKSMDDLKEGDLLMLYNDECFPDNFKIGKVYPIVKFYDNKYGVVLKDDVDDSHMIHSSSTINHFKKINVIKKQPFETQDINLIIQSYCYNIGSAIKCLSEVGKININSDKNIEISKMKSALFYIQNQINLLNNDQSK